ncbi:hypothetical protein [Lysobacter gummosus]|uniref:hypothetical protein n=1 Tax=Lysobacter gummosus TaxID=262324 RepID=UPI00362DD28A
MDCNNGMRPTELVDTLELAPTGARARCVFDGFNSCLSSFGNMRRTCSGRETIRQPDDQADYRDENA